MTTATDTRPDAVVHAPAGKEAFLEPGAVREFLATIGTGQGVPASYSVVPGGIDGIAFDIGPESEIYLHGHCFRSMHTPGHGPHACTYVVEIGGRQLAFCGDAARSLQRRISRTTAAPLPSPSASASNP